MIRVSPPYTLTHAEWLKKKNNLIALAKVVFNSVHRDIFPETETINPNRYRDGVDEIFHLELGPKDVRCLITRTEGVRKKKKVYEFCYHHHGFCPYQRLMLKRKVL